jgi:serine/threonine protein kinase
MRENGIKNFSEDKAIDILRQVRDGFEELRKKGVIHRDLKLSNIFMHDETILIGIFEILNGFKKIFLVFKLILT